MCFLCILFCRPSILVMIAVMVARMGVWEFDDGMIVFKSLFNLIHAGECPCPKINLLSAFSLLNQMNRFKPQKVKYHRGIRASLHERRVTKVGEKTLLGGQWWGNPPVDIIFDMRGHPTHHLNVIKLK